VAGSDSPRGQLAQRLARLAEAARRTSQAAADDREARDEAIADADELGMGIREIARHTNMVVSHVQRIVAAKAAERQG